MALRVSRHALRWVPSVVSHQSSPFSSRIEVATMTGHKTLNTLERYTHPNVTEIARKLG